MAGRGCFAVFPALVRRLTIRVSNNLPKVYPTLEEDQSSPFSFEGSDSNFNAIPFADVNGADEEGKHASVVGTNGLSTMGSESEFVAIPLSPTVPQQAHFIDKADLMERGLVRRPEARGHAVGAGVGEQTDAVFSMVSESEFAAVPLSPAVPQQAHFIDEADLMERGLVRRPEVRERHTVVADLDSMVSDSGFVAILLSPVVHQQANSADEADLMERSLIRRPEVRQHRIVDVGPASSMVTESNFAVVPLSTSPRQIYTIDEADLMERGLVRRPEVRQRHAVDDDSGDACHVVCAGDTAALVHPKPQHSDCVVWVGAENGRSEVVERMVEMAETTES